MIKLAVLILAAVCYHQVVLARRLTGQINNEILNESPNIGIGLGRNKDWVRISRAPSTIISRPVGAQIELECEAMGSPAPVMQWLKDNTPLTENESFETNAINDNPSQGMAKVKSRLLINSALPIHEGVFTCIAEAGSEVATSKTKLYLSRNGARDRNFTQLLAGNIIGSHTPARIVLFDTIYMDNIGNEIVLPCKAVGNPRPDVLWLDPSERVIGSTDEGRLSVLPDGELRMRNVRWDDMGAYTCLARNSLGQDSITTFVYPMLATK